MKQFLWISIATLLLASAGNAKTICQLNPPRSQQSADSGFIASFTLAPVQTEEVLWHNLSYTTYKLAGEGFLGRPGEPDLPIVNRLIQMPDFSDIQVEFLGGEFVELDHALPLPFQTDPEEGADQYTAWQQNPLVYERNAWYPAEPFRLGDPVLLRNNRLCKLSLQPVQVNPVTGEVRIWTRMNFRITFAGQNSLNARIQQLTDEDRQLKGAIAQAIINQPNSDQALSNAWLDPGDSPGKYLVIGQGQAFEEPGGLPEWIDWKRQRGHTVVIDSSSAILWSNVLIRERITTEYFSEDPVDFVMLVGDTDGAFALPSGITNQYDHYYAAIDGTDILPDVSVGRLSVDNITQLLTVCNKIIQYEKEPFLEQPEWLQHAGFVLSSIQCTAAMKQTSRSIAHELVDSRAYNQIDTLWCVNSSGVEDLFYSGLSFYNYLGWVGMEGLNPGEVQNWTQGRATPVVTLFSEGTGDFTTGDDFTETFLRAGFPTNPGGAVASLGFATVSVLDRYANVICGGFYGAFLEHEVPEVGSCLMHAKHEIFLTLPPGDIHSSNYMNRANLMGDPGMRMWAGVPQAISVEIPEFIHSGSNFLDLEILAQGLPVSGIVVGAWQENQEQIFQTTILSDDFGSARLDLQDIEAGPLVITLSSPTHIPQQHILFVDSTAFNPQINNWAVDGNSFLQAGFASQQFEFNLYNAGAIALTEISIQAQLDPRYGQVQGGTLDIAGLAPGGTSTLVTGFSIDPATDLSDSDSLPLVLNLNTTEGSLQILVSIGVSAPTFSLVGQEYPGGIWQAGNSHDLELTLINSGSQTALAAEVELLSDSHLVLVEPQIQELQDLLPGESVVLAYTASVVQLALPGMLIPLHLDINSSGGDIFQQIELAVPIGVENADAPTGPDAGGYYAFEAQDTAYPQSPQYDWIGIAPQEDGPGELVPLEDFGEGQDDGFLMDLPFGFFYYGEYYEEIMICSNGFVSFGDPGVFYEVDFRNHVLPSAMGPDAMIAPMWDNHLCTPGGVYTWFDESQHIFVVEWYNLQAYSSGGPNTFQLLLYDPAIYHSGSGDGEFKIQYHTWNDNSSQSQDFPFCTVGIKDHSSTIGMTLKHYNILNPTMHEISDSSAIFFTTTVDSLLSSPQLVLGAESFEIELPAEASHRDSLEIFNTGEAALVYATWLSFEQRDSGGPDSYGYHWLDSREEAGPDFNWITERPDALPVTFAHGDSSSGWFETGFDFYLFGNRNDQFRISPNGYLCFSMDEGRWGNHPPPSEFAPENSICVWWDDLRPTVDTAGFCWYWTNNTDSLVVSWTNVPHYNAGLFGGPFTFQVIVCATGEITMQYADLHEGQSGTAGLQANSVEQGFSVFHNQVVAVPYALRIIPPTWVTIDRQQGIIPGMATNWLQLEFRSAAGYLLNEGPHMATLHLESNDPQQQFVSVPLTLTVTGTGVGDSQLLPLRTGLGENYPNPFNAATRIRFELATEDRVTISVYNLLGQELGPLLESGQLQPGHYEILWQTENLASGLYLLDMSTSRMREQKKVLLLK